MDNMEDRGIPAYLRVEVAMIGILLVILAVLVWGAFTLTDQPTPETGQPGIVGVDEPRNDVEEPSNGDDVTTTDPPAEATRMERCVSAHDALQAPLEAARPALDQWKVHVGAMNQLVVGEITLRQATAFWNRTRVGAQRRVEAFDAAWAALRRDGVDCPSPRLMAPAMPALRPCARQVEAEIRVLEAARTSIRTWAEHVRHMDMLRMGTMSPEDATAMWLSMWQQGVRDLDAYRLAARGAQESTGCAEAAASG
jgi:hypothetical protein